MQDALLDEIEMIPYADGKLSWPSPAPGPHEKFVEHITTMPPESPLFFGMHPNAEINFRTVQCERVFDVLMTLAGGDTGGGGGGDDTEVEKPEKVAEAMTLEILEELKEKFKTDEIGKMPDEEKGPYQYVFIQECDLMNGLINEMVRGLQELVLGFKGELTMSEQMETLFMSLYNEKLPFWWVELGFPSTRPLRSWRFNLQERYTQLEDWTNDPVNIPKVTDVSKFFNPQSFLTAIKQLACQLSGTLELDKLQVYTEVTKKEPKQVEAAARDGAFVQGMFLEGARWEIASQSLEDSRPKEMAVLLPVVLCKAGPMAEKVDKNSYICPTYCVPTRRPYFVFPAQLRTKAPSDKWVLAGVAIILDMVV
jgi:dynein heavy chain